MKVEINITGPALMQTVPGVCVTVESGEYEDEATEAVETATRVATECAEKLLEARRKWRTP